MRILPDSPEFKKVMLQLETDVLLLAHWRALLTTGRVDGHTTATLPSDVRQRRSHARNRQGSVETADAAK
jgi:hypothetical protein